MIQFPNKNPKIEPAFPKSLKTPVNNPARPYIDKIKGISGWDIYETIPKVIPIVPPTKAPSV